MLITKLRSTNSVETQQYKKATKALLVLLPLLGVTYILVLTPPTEDGLLAQVFAYLQPIINSTQVGQQHQQHAGGPTASAVRRWANSINSTQVGQQHQQHAGGPTASTARRWANSISNTLLGQQHQQHAGGPTASTARRWANSISSTQVGQQHQQHAGEPTASAARRWANSISIHQHAFGVFSFMYQSQSQYQRSINHRSLNPSLSRYILTQIQTPPQIVGYCDMIIV